MLNGGLTMKITYIHHSCFLVETKNYQLIFDYFEGVLPPLDSRKKTIFFASHNHGDHFNSIIFNLIEDSSFVLSSDIRYPLNNNCLIIEPDAHVEFKGLTIETLKSTDEGVAFIVHCDNQVIYHAGDLNWWHWDPECEQDIEDNQRMAELYKLQIDKIKGRSFDIAFIPLDPRLDYAASWGMKYFLECVEVNWVFPMHMWQQLFMIDHYLNGELKEYRDIIQIIKEENEVFEQ